MILLGLLRPYLDKRPVFRLLVVAKWAMLRLAFTLPSPLEAGRDPVAFLLFFLGGPGLPAAAELGMTSSELMLLRHLAWSSAEGGGEWASAAGRRTEVECGRSRAPRTARLGVLLDSRVEKWKAGHPGRRGSE